jgi:hypothetical protein
LKKAHLLRAILLKVLHIQLLNYWRLRIIDNSRFKRLLKNWIFWLFIITGLAIIIRSFPGWIHGAWGCDFGIYYGITKSVAQSGVIFPPYTGWGGSYNYFPVLYSINAFASWITGIDILALMPKLTPIFGGLAVLVFYFVVNQLVNNKKIAILCTLFFAFMPFHVYQTSHASPLTMGHFFMMVSLFLFLKFRKNTMYFFPLMISTFILIMSHHLSTYFYLISMIAIIFVENVCVKEWTASIKKDIFYVILTSLLVFSYWAFVAKTVYENFMSGFSIGGLNFGSFFVIVIFYIGFFFVFGIIKLIRRVNNYFETIKEEVNNSNKKTFIKVILKLYPFIKKKWPSTKSRILRFFLVIIVIIGTMLVLDILGILEMDYSYVDG